jgi:hypothetical protein
MKPNQFAKKVELKEKISRNNFLRHLGFTGAYLMAIYSIENWTKAGELYN